MIFIFMKIYYHVKKMQQDTGAKTSHNVFKTKVGVQITSVAQLTDQSSPKTFNLYKLNYNVLPSRESCLSNATIRIFVH